MRKIFNEGLKIQIEELFNSEPNLNKESESYKTWKNLGPFNIENALKMQKSNDKSTDLFTYNLIFTEIKY